MPKAFYVWTRDLHLYLGLFVSPFLIAFAVSVFFVNHARFGGNDSAPAVRSVGDMRIPGGIEQAEGMERARLAREILEQVGVAGEINFIRSVPEERRLVIPVVRPGVETVIELDVVNRSAKVSTRTTTLGETLSYLHRSPGPHSVAIRGNWLWTRVWGWLADATVYLTLFLSASGIYLWAALRSERRIGLVLLGAGAASFVGVVYAVVR